METSIYYTKLQWKNFKLCIAATKEGLMFIGSAEEGKYGWENWLLEHAAIRNDEALETYSRQVKEYLQGKRKTFDVPLAPQGTDFQQLVWQALQRVPYGETRTYSDIANTIGRPEAVRAVASAIGKNRLLIVIPCHRVIRKDGGLSGFRDGVQMKKKLLDIEKENVNKLKHK